MTDTAIQKTEALRDELYADLEKSELFRAVQALDDAVFALGGPRRLPRKGGVLIRVNGVAQDRSTQPAAELAPSMPARLSQPDMAAEVLREAGRPMTVRELVPALRAKGVVFAASDPVASFGSQLSRNPAKFLSRKIDGQYYWWLRDTDWPVESSGEADLLKGTEGEMKQGGERMPTTP